MVTKIVLKFGPSGTMAHLSFDPGVTTVFVGPNNSGKSLILREIEEFCRSGEASVFNKLRMLANVSVALPEFSHIMAFLSQRRVGAKDTETFSIHEMQPTGTGPPQV
jgi:ABC-type cobalamin/Fe3+-siderophores transport system ATPase subunit